MKEYIEREAALNAMSKAQSDRTWSMDDCDVMNQMFDYVEEVPTADVAPVVHGEWREEFRSQINPDGYFYWDTPQKKIYVCSICGREEVKKEPYCNCGAKMDGGNK